MAKILRRIWNRLQGFEEIQVRMSRYRDPVSGETRGDVFFDIDSPLSFRYQLRQLRSKLKDRVKFTWYDCYELYLYLAGRLFVEDTKRYRFAVDPGSSTEQLLKDGGFEHKSDREYNCMMKHALLSPSFDLIGGLVAGEEIEGVLLRHRFRTPSHFSRFLVGMRQQGYRPATEKEGLALLLKYPEVLDRVYSLGCFGTVRHHPSHIDGNAHKKRDYNWETLRLSKLDVDGVRRAYYFCFAAGASSYYLAVPLREGQTVSTHFNPDMG